MAFLFVWQFLISGPLEIASGLIILATFFAAVDPVLGDFISKWTWKMTIPGTEFGVAVGPARLAAFACGLLVIGLLYRRIAILGRVAVSVWIGVLGVIAWILIEGFCNFDPAVAFDFSGAAATWPDDLGKGFKDVALP